MTADIEQRWPAPFLLRAAIVNANPRRLSEPIPASNSPAVTCSLSALDAPGLREEVRNPQERHREIQLWTAT
jgi:hypothetical protein